MLVVTILFALTFCLTACTQNQDARTTSEAETSAPTTTLAGSSSGVAEVTSSSNDGAVGGNTAPYQGYGKTYTYRYQTERDRNWEKLITTIADKITDPVQGHVRVVKHKVSGRRYYPWIQYSSQLTDHYQPDSSAREGFLQRINEALDAIPSSNDAELQHRIDFAFAALNDIHSHFFLKNEAARFLPVYYSVMANEEGMPILVIVAGAPEYENLLKAKLLEIGGHSVAECTEKIWPYITHENSYDKMEQINGSKLYTAADLLKIVGIISDIETVELKIELPDGTIKSVSIKSVTADELRNIKLAYATADLTPVRLQSKEHYFSKWVPEDGIFYVKYRQCADEDGKVTREEFFSGVLKQIDSINEPFKFIFDLRGNPGGHPVDHTKLLTFLHDHNIPTYVLIDGRVASGAVITSVHCKQINPNSIFVGRPSSQGPNFPLGLASEELEIGNLKFDYRISHFYSESDLGNTDDAIFPDHELMWNYRDYIQGIDTLYEWVKAHNPEQ